MFVLFNFFCLCSFLSAETSVVVRNNPHKALMLADLEFMKQVFEVSYAPAQWKREHFGWDINKEFAKTQNLINSNPALSIKDYQKEVKRILLSTRDYHVGFKFVSTERATLPLAVKGINGKYYVSAVADYAFEYIDQDANVKKLPATDGIPVTEEPKIIPPIQEGDEIVLFDGKPVHEVITQLKATETNNSNPATDQIIAEIFLTRRSAAAGMDVPCGPIMIAVKSKFSGKLETYQANWDYEPEEVACHMDAEAPKPKSNKWEDNPLLNVKMEAPICALLTDKEATKKFDHANPNGLGERKSFIPDMNGKKIWESARGSVFYAYMFITDDNKIGGYVRIPTYDIEGTGEPWAFAETIACFEKFTDFMIVDQVNNGGGIVFYGYALAAMLANEPLTAPKQQVALTQAMVFDAIYTLKELESITNDEEAQRELWMFEFLLGYPVDYSFVESVRNYFSFMVDQWNQGKFLTDPVYIFGIEKINPHHTAHYTKPILFVVNEFDFSCADFVPAILQDNKRVTVFGAKTAGAGGYVDGFEYPNRLGILSIHFTGSIAERTNGQPIENLGITPDIPYTLTESDVRDGYQEYGAAILKAATSLLKK